MGDLLYEPIFEEGQEGRIDLALVIYVERLLGGSLFLLQKGHRYGSKSLGDKELARVVRPQPIHEVAFCCLVSYLFVRRLSRLDVIATVDEASCPEEWGAFDPIDDNMFRHAWNRLDGSPCRV